jgi:hypothetical protein
MLLAALGTVAAVTWPALAVSTSRSARVACVNNLRLMGRATHMWAGDHGGLNPWWVRTPDGTRGDAMARNAWYQYLFLSNQFVTPKLLVCPSDPQKRTASDWGLGPGGFLNSAYRGNSVSYFIAVDASPLLPHSPLFGDRNVRYDFNGTCSLGLPNVWGLQTRPPSSWGKWTNDLHGITGNLVLQDGRVLQASASDFTNAVATMDDNGQTHFLTP